MRNLWWEKATFWRELGLCALIAALAFIVGSIVGRLTARSIRRFLARTRYGRNELLLPRLRGPLVALWSLVAAGLIIENIELGDELTEGTNRFIRSSFVLVLFWTLLRIVDVVAHGMIRTSWAEDRPASRSLIPLGSRAVKALLFCGGLIAFLSQLGFPVTSLIAGLGVGGLAVALAARKTLENLFGTFALGVDQPFRHGDLVRVDNVLGHVESIGLRSTRIRTLERTVVTMPNAQLADMRIECLSTRDHQRLACDLALARETRPDQIRRILARLDAILRANPLCLDQDVVARLRELGPYAWIVEITAALGTRDFGVFAAARQELLLAFTEAVAAEGASLAYPTQTVAVQQPVRPSGT